MEVKRTENEKKFDSSEIVLKNRQDLHISGVEKVYETSETKLLIKISGSDCAVLGENMSVEKLDVESGTLGVNGKINEIRYAEGANKGNFFKRIFR